MTTTFLERGRRLRGEWHCEGGSGGVQWEKHLRQFARKVPFAASSSSLFPLCSTHFALMAVQEGSQKVHQVGAMRGSHSTSPSQDVYLAWVWMFTYAGISCHSSSLDNTRKGTTCGHDDRVHDCDRLYARQCAQRGLPSHRRHLAPFHVCHIIEVQVCRDCFSSLPVSPIPSHSPSP